jgi:membrane-associated protease RseP (regulator of RpoE activity)
MRLSKVVLIIAGMLLGVLQGLGIPHCLAAELPRQSDWQLRISADPNTRDLRIASVQSGSPAAQAGLRSGDRIVEIDGQPVATAYDIARARHRSKGDQPVRFTVERDAARSTIAFTPRARPKESHRVSRCATSRRRRTPDSRSA